MFTSCSVNLFCFSHREVNKNLFIFWPIRWDFCGKDLFLYFENQLFSGVNNKKAQKQSQYWKKTLLPNFQNRSKMNDIENKLFADHFCHSWKFFILCFFMYYFHSFSLLFYVLLEWNFVIISSCFFLCSHNLWIEIHVKVNSLWMRQNVNMQKKIVANLIFFHNFPYLYNNNSFTF